MKLDVERHIVYSVSFFLFSGYYLGLSLFFISGYQAFSRFYSIPLRAILSALMLYYIFRNISLLRRSSVICYLLLCFSIVYIVKILHSEASNVFLGRDWYEYIFYYLSFSVLPFLFYSSVDFVKYHKYMLSAFMLSGLLLGIISVVAFWDVILSGGVSRISMLTYETGESVISPLALAYSGAITILICLYQLVFQKVSKLHFFYIVLTFLISIVIFLLGATRGALLALVLGCVSLLYFASFNKKIIFSIILMLCIPIIKVGINLTGSGIVDRTVSTVETGETSGRDRHWANAFSEFASHPFIGGRIEIGGIYPHNIFLEVLMATGAIGMVLFIVITASSLFNGIKKVKSNRLFLISFIVFICGVSQHMVTGSLWGAITLFSSLGMFNSASTR